MDKDIHINWMRKVLSEAERAIDEGEIPVAAILVSDNEELARSQTRVSREGTLAAHAELFAILRANGALWTAKHPLVIYTNLEPCVMCLGAAMQVGVDMIVYGMKASPDGGSRYTRSIKRGGQTPPKIISGILEEESVDLFRKLLKVNPEQPAIEYVKEMLREY